MNLLLAMFLSPVVMLLLAAAAVWGRQICAAPKAPTNTLVSLTLIFAVAGAVVSLLFTVGWMVWYERTTGYSAGNAPVGWILFYGPAGAALGQLLALVVWWFKKPTGSPSNAA